MSSFATDRQRHAHESACELGGMEFQPFTQELQIRQDLVEIADAA